MEMKGGKCLKCNGNICTHHAEVYVCEKNKWNHNDFDGMYRMLRNIGFDEYIIDQIRQLLQKNMVMEYL